MIIVFEMSTNETKMFNNDDTNMELNVRSNDTFAFWAYICSMHEFNSCQVYGIKFKNAKK